MTIVQSEYPGIKFSSLENLDPRILFINWFGYVSLDDNYQLRKIYLYINLLFNRIKPLKNLAFSMSHAESMQDLHLYLACSTFDSGPLYKVLKQRWTSRFLV